MHQVCGQCGKTLEFSGDAPKFCGYCGRALAETEVEPAKLPTGASTLGYDPEAQTRVPAEGSSEFTQDVPEIIGRYRLLRRLGAGGMGAVFEAEDSTTQKHVALKLVAPEFLQSSDARERFRREGQLASRLHHPRCVFVLSAAEAAGRPYIVMELMPGETLHDLVRAKGPLPPQEAIRKILDVIDGLQEVHRAGLVHRDIKPSNCFLEADGRVKIGDFGLAKSLLWDVNLTKSGSFLGTALYAAPEQIKSEPVDAQSDLYAAAATLYFLLCGRAPFQDCGDGLATMAAIVSESPPPLKKFRPHLPTGLENAVLRGLERDRSRRWRSLAQFRQALLRYMPAEPTVAGLGIRFVAYLLDILVVLLISYLALGWFIASKYQELIAEIVGILYWGIIDGLWGATPGKRLFSLRVYRTRSDEAPGVPRAMLRVFVLSLLSRLGDLGSLIRFGSEAGAGAFAGLGGIVGLLLILITMRRRNGYRGLHEFLSGTRTVVLQTPTASQQSAIQRVSACRTALSMPEEAPEKVGAFVVRGALRWDEQARVLLAQDPDLDRPVWIWLRSGPRQPIDHRRSELSRETRLRWLANGVLDGNAWSAFAAPDGCSLTTLMADENGLSWSETRQVLESLSRELKTAADEKSLPDILHSEQVWIQPDGRILLLDESAEPVAAVPPSPIAETHVEDPSLEFLRQTAILALEGRHRTAKDQWLPIQAPVPVHARTILDRLLVTGKETQKAYATVDALAQDLGSTRLLPSAVTRRHRIIHLVLMSLFLWLPLGFLLMMVYEIVFSTSIVDYDESGGPPNVAVTAGNLVIMAIVLPIWAFLTRNGIGYGLAGIYQRQRDGKPIARWRAVLHSILKWAPFLALLAVALVFAHDVQHHTWAVGLAIAAGLLPVGYAVLAIWQPTRSLFERVTGIYLVPG